MKRTTQAIAAACAALMLASCGKDEGEPIPARQADRMDSLLQQVQRQSDAGSCTTLLDKTIPALEDRARRLPDSVGSDTQETITDGIAHLRDLAETDCAEKQQEELPDTTDSTESESTTTTTEPSTSTESTDTSPSTSTDTSPSTSTDTSPSTDTTPPDNPDNGNGGSTVPPANGGATPKGNGKGNNGNGNGNGGGKK
jgi:hypothetical protein